MLKELLIKKMNQYNEELIKISECTNKEEDIEKMRISLQAEYMLIKIKHKLYMKYLELEKKETA